MTRETVSSNRVAILATGDEISNGDILNSNSQEIAKRLFSNGMHVGLHMTAPDTVSEIEQSILFLLQSHRALIMTGGLGPTSDDLTRYALSKALNKPLVFDNSTWEDICLRLKKLGYHNPPQTNRQQALFPEDATIIPNPNGTAAGCMIEHAKQFIFMLPGPPIECLPMVDKIVFPYLQQAGFQEILYFDHWLLFGVSEGQIAEELDALAKPFNCKTGYRLAYPYIEFKLYSNHQDDFLKLVPLIENTIRPYLIGNGKHMASTLLQNKLTTLDFKFSIADSATGGLLESTIKTPLTCAHLSFTPEATDIHIQGLDEFWQEKKECNQTHLEMTFLKTSQHIKTQIPFRGIRVKQYAVEFICKQIYAFLTKSDTS